jgi:hypothetical protein
MNLIRFHANGDGVTLNKASYSIDIISPIFLIKVVRHLLLLL